MKTAEKLRNKILAELKQFKRIEQCALLGYPGHYNVGDRMIWLGEIFFLENINNTKILYKGNFKTFNAKKFERIIGQKPIFLSGGGDFGDLYLDTQKFREFIVSNYHKNEIIIFPQTIFFKHKENLDRTKRIFNRHPNLTIFTREKVSYELAKQYFPNTNIKLIPDMAFILYDYIREIVRKKYEYNVDQDRIIFLLRSDKELNEQLNFYNIPNAVVVEWLDAFLKPSIAHFISKIRQKRSLFIEILNRIKNWIRTKQITNELMLNKDVIKSTKIVNGGIDLLINARLIITNRLHGHILSSLMGITNIFLPNNYHKNWSFYNTWTRNDNISHWANNRKEVLELISQIINIER